MNGGQGQGRQAPPIEPITKAACDALIAEIEAHAEDVHAEAHQLSSAVEYLVTRLRKLSQESVTDLDAMIAEKRRARKSLRTVGLVKPVPPPPPKIEPVIPSRPMPLAMPAPSEHDGDAS